MNTDNDILTLLGTLAASATGIFAIFLAVFAILMPLLIYLIHRSTRRTAIATEKIVKQNERLIEMIGDNNQYTKDFEFGVVPLQEKEVVRPKDFGKPLDFSGGGNSKPVPGHSVNKL